jgi:hypothetical protein
MKSSVFVEAEFWLLVLCTFIAPFAILWLCLTIRKVSRHHVLAVGFVLVALAGIDIYLLQVLKRLAQATVSTADDVLFNSEVTIGLYVLPALLAGLGINIASHVIIEHLSDAQARFLRRDSRPEQPQPDSASRPETIPQSATAARPAQNVA